METDSISYRPRNGKGNKKTQSKERFKDFFNKYFVGGKISRNDYRNRKGAGSLAGGYSYFMPLFQLIKNHSAKDNVPLNLNDSEVCKNQDIIAVIVKIDFGDKSEVYPDKYIDEMKRGEWTKWNTPRKYKYLEGKGKKLILYDRELKALTVEVEIQEVNNTNDELEYPWCNKFALGTLKVYQKPIPIENLRSINGFENFSVYRKDRSSHRNLTQEQYAKLIGSEESYDIESNEALEGYQSDKIYLSKERNRDLVQKRKIKDNFTCQACEFRLELQGKFIIECHHTIPLADTGERITNLNELVCLCPTCHRIAHTHRPPYTVTEIANIRK